MHKQKSSLKKNWHKFICRLAEPSQIRQTPTCCVSTHPQEPIKPTTQGERQHDPDFIKNEFTCKEDKHCLCQPQNVCALNYCHS